MNTQSLNFSFSYLYIAILLIIICSSSAHGYNDYNKESWYRDIWCYGETEVKVFPKGVSPRCDCLTENFAIEVDFARKWHEAVGQSLFYGHHLKRIPGILLIITKPSDMKHLNNLIDMINVYKLPIRVWAIDKSGKKIPIK